MARDFDSEKIAARWNTSGRIYMVQTGCGLLGITSSTKSEYFILIWRMTFCDEMALNDAVRAGIQFMSTFRCCSVITL